MKITISKTFQVRQYEPLTVTVEEESIVKSNSDYEQLKKKVSACLEDIASTELTKYKKLSDNE